MLPRDENREVFAEELEQLVMLSRKIAEEDITDEDIENFDLMFDELQYCFQSGYYDNDHYIQLRNLCEMIRHDAMVFLHPERF